MSDKIFSSKFAFLLSLIILAGFPFLANAGVYINEVAYDISGVDEKREWIEIYNDSNSEIKLTDWKFNDGSNHLLSEPPKNGGKGSLILPSQNYAVLADNAERFIIDYPDYFGILIDTVMNLNNDGDTLKILDDKGNEIDSVSYNKKQGADGDGNSLQKAAGTWGASLSTPGSVNAGQSSPSNPNNGSSSSDGSQSVSSSVSSSAQVEQSFGQSGPVNWPSEERIFANAGGDKTVIVGADTFFFGKSLGLKKEPLDNAKYLWNFGDGSYAEGQNVKHSYKYPGGYIVALDVSSGKFLASDRLNVKAVPNELQIIEANKDFIKIKNKSSFLIDISDWFLRNNGSVFKFPESSFIAAGAELSISSEVSKIIFTGNGQTAEILYPNGSVAFSYQEKTTSSSSVSSASISSFSSIPLISLAASASRSSSASSTRAFAALSKKPSPSVGNNDKKIIKRQMLNTATATKTNFIREDQLANAITIANKKDFWSGKWLWVALIAGIFGGGGLIFIRRNNGA